MSTAASLDDLLKKHSFLQLQPERSRVHCTITGRDMTTDIDVVQQHVQGKKLRKMMEW